MRAGFRPLQAAQISFHFGRQHFAHGGRTPDGREAPRRGSATLRRPAFTAARFPIAHGPLGTSQKVQTYFRTTARTTPPTTSERFGRIGA